MSFIDDNLSFCRYSKLRKWIVMDTEDMSNHRYIYFELDKKTEGRQEKKKFLVDWKILGDGVRRRVTREELKDG